MAGELIPGLGGLAQGLRLAGGVVSPHLVGPMVARQDEANQLQAERMKQLQIAQTVRGIESGAIDPRQGQAVLEQMGFQAPVGPGPEAQARQEALRQQAAMRSAVAQLPPDATIEQKLAAAAPHMPVEQQMKLYEISTIKKTQLEQQLERMRQDFELKRSEIQRKEDRDAWDLRFKTADLEIRQKLADLKTLGDATKPPSGYRFKEGGNLEPIPGGPADVKNQNLDQRTLVQLGSAIEKSKLNEANATMSAAEDLLAAHPDALEYLAGPKRLLPDLVIPKDARDVRQAVQKVLNIEIKNRSGAAVTVPEWARFQKEWGNGVFNRPDQVLTAMDQARNALNAHAAGVVAPWGSEVVKAYNENLQGVGGVPFVGSEKRPPLSSRFGNPVTRATPQVGGAPRPGTVEDGYRFKGGDPGKRENWEKI